MISATVAGRLGADAQMREVGSDDLCEFSVAVDERVKGERRTTWVRCTLWGKRGAALAPHLRKGDAVTVVGALSVRLYESKKDGSTQASVEVKVSEVTLQGSAGEPRGQAAPRQAQREPARRGEPAGPRFDDGAMDDDIPF
ncbi:MAG: single-stranded DNA-binding protein [Myxococcales bacterium]|nr:single-stranded DNA-binding protein [Myxococcales bacterium]